MKEKRGTEVEGVCEELIMTFEYGEEEGCWQGQRIVDLGRIDRVGILELGRFWSWDTRKIQGGGQSGMFDTEIVMGFAHVVN